MSRPLLERDPEEIERELAAHFGLDRDAVHVDRLSLGDGREVAYLRAVWEPGQLCMPEPEPIPEPEPGAEPIRKGWTRRKKKSPAAD